MPAQNHTLSEITEITLPCADVAERWSVMTEDGLTMLREDIFTREEALQYVADNPTTPNGKILVAAPERIIRAAAAKRKQIGDQAALSVEAKRISATRELLDTYPTIGRDGVPAGSFIPLRPLAESGFEQLPDKWLVCTPCRDADLNADVLTVTFAYSGEADARKTAAHLHERGYDVTLVKPAEKAPKFQPIAWAVPRPVDPIRKARP